jgi:hypothetical protein
MMSCKIMALKKSSSENRLLLMEARSERVRDWKGDRYIE